MMLGASTQGVSMGGRLCEVLNLSIDPLYTSGVWKRLRQITVTSEGI